MMVKMSVLSSRRLEMGFASVIEVRVCLVQGQGMQGATLHGGLGSFSDKARRGRGWQIVEWSVDRRQNICSCQEREL